MKITMRCFTEYSWFAVWNWDAGFVLFSSDLLVFHPCLKVKNTSSSSQSQQISVIFTAAQ